MAHVLQVYHATTGDTLYAVVRRNSDGALWNGSAFETPNGSNWTTYAVTMSQQSTTRYWYATLPSGIATNALYNYDCYKQAGGSPAVDDEYAGQGWIDGSTTGDRGLSSVVDDSGRVDVGKVLGTAQTARDLGNALPAAAPNANGGLPILSSSGTTLGYTITTLTTYTGNTPQTGDGYAVVTNGTYGLSALKTLIDAIQSTANTLSSKLGTFTGVTTNSVYGFLLAMMKKDVSAPSTVGGTFDPATDSLEALRDRGDVAWITATGFSTLTTADIPTTTQIWAAGTRTLTSGSNIVLAKGTGVTGFTDLSAAQVNAEVVDALNVDTYAEPTGAPAATASLATKLGFLHEALRNKVTVTDSLMTFYNDAGAAQWSKVLADNGTTYTESEGT